MVLAAGAVAVAYLALRPQPAPTAAAAARKPPPPKAQSASVEPSWTLAPRRPVAEEPANAPVPSPVVTAPTAAVSAPGTTPAGALPSVVPPPTIEVIAFPDAARSYSEMEGTSSWRQTVGGGTMNCIRSTFVRDGVRGVEVLCMRPGAKHGLRYLGAEAEWRHYEGRYRAMLGDL
jgi:hypothetical protein